MSQTEFSEAVAKLQPTLRMFTHRFTYDKEESQDLVQDTLLRALTYRDKFRSDVNLKGWLFTIMRNTYINRYRKSKREQTFTDPAHKSYALHVEDEHTFNRPQESMEFQEIWQNMNSIREELLIPFRMHTTGYKYEEIAQQLNLPIGTVKNRIFHARKEIQKKLAGYR